MNNTHIIIPISLIENRVKIAKQEADECRKKGWGIAENSARTRGLFYQMLLDDKNLKQISLDEKDIDIRKSGEYAHDSEEQWKGSHRKTIAFNFHLEGYKQALKDLK